MLQQIIAIVVIVYFLVRIIKQRRKKQVSKNEFFLWLVFWIIGIIVIVQIKALDKLVANLGFSSSGINILLYIAIIILFHLVFKLRIRLEKQEKNITKLTRELAIKNKE